MTHDLTQPSNVLYYQYFDNAIEPIILKGFDLHKVLEAGHDIILRGMRYRIDRIDRKDHGGTFENPEHKKNTFFIAEISIITPSNT